GPGDRAPRGSREGPRASFPAELCSWVATAGSSGFLVAILGGGLGRLRGDRGQDPARGRGISSALRRRSSPGREKADTTIPSSTLQCWLLAALPAALLEEDVRAIGLGRRLPGGCGLWPSPSPRRFGT